MGRKAFSTFLLCGSASLAVTSAALAQDQAPAPDAQAKSSGGSNTSIGFEDIVVTAQKRAESLQNVPIAVTALGGSELLTANIRGQVDLPKLTPNLNFTVNQGFASAYIRGVGTQYGNPGLEASVSVYFNDVFVPRASSAMFNFIDIERIEVLKGPQGTLYGRNATGGAIRIITKDPVDEFEGKVQGVIGSYRTRNVAGMLNVPLSEGIALRVSAQHDENKGYMRNVNPGGDANGHTRGGNVNSELYTAKLLIERDRLKIKLSGDYASKRDRDSVAAANLFPGAPEQIGAALGGAVSDGFYTYANDAQDHLRVKAYGGELRIDYDADTATLSSITGYRVEQENNCSDIDATGAFVQPVCGAPRTRQFTQELQVASNGSGPLRYVAGLYFLRERSGYPFYVRAGTFGPPIDADGSRLGLISGPDDQLKVLSLSPYAQIDWDFTSNLSLSLGGRYTYERKELTENYAFVGIIGPDGTPASNIPVMPSPVCTEASPAPCNDPGKSTDFKVFTYKATLSWKPVDKVMLYGTISKGFKSGGLNLPALTYVSVVKPETLQDYELGWKTEFGPIRWNGAAFYYDYKDLQIAITNQQTGGTDIRNAASARVKGIETDLAIIPTQGLELGFGGAYTDATYRNFRGQAYYPCGDVPGLSTPDAEAAEGVAAAGAVCAAQGNLGLALVDGRVLSGKRLINTPKWSGYARAQYRYDTGAIGTFTLSGIVNYRSVAYFDSGNLFPDKKRALVSARLAWEAPDERFFASIYGENLTKVEYNSVAAPQSTGGWRIPAPPRQIFAMVGVKF